MCDGLKIEFGVEVHHQLVKEESKVGIQALKLSYTIEDEEGEEAEVHIVVSDWGISLTTFKNGHTCHIKDYPSLAIWNLIEEAAQEFNWQPYDIEKGETD